MTVKPLRQTVRAEQENIPRLISHRPDLRVHELIAASERLLQNIPPRMRPCFAFIELAVAEHPAHISVVMADLFDRAFAFGKIIDSAVPNVTESTSSPA
jgi:hypothetical protein